MPCPGVTMPTMRSPGTAPVRWNLGAAWHGEPWRAQYRVRYNGPRFVDTANTRYLKPYQLHEVGASVGLGRGWEALLNVRNLTNETYAEIENQPPPGRELLLTLRWGWDAETPPKRKTPATP